MRTAFARDPPNVPPSSTNAPSAKGVIPPYIAQKKKPRAPIRPLPAVLPRPKAARTRSEIKIQTPVIPKRLAALLGAHPHAPFLTAGFTFGFRVPHINFPPLPRPPNHKSARDNPSFLSAYVHKELAAGRILGPFESPPFSNFVSSPLGLVPKKDPGEFRVIHDLSYPKGRSVNDAIPQDLTSVVYEDFDTVVSILAKLPMGALMAKVDIQHAFRILPIHPEDIHLFGFTWEDKFYVDKCLPMGCSISCALFELFSATIQDVLLSHFSFKYTSHILDDFMFFSPPKSPLAQQQLDTFLDFARYAGIPIKESKTVLPATVVTMHGIEVDSVARVARLPQDKLQNMSRILSDFRVKRSARLHQWQSLIGHLNFACRVIRPGRPFLRKFINATKAVYNQHHFIRITQEHRADCSLWLAFLRTFNGVSTLSSMAPPHHVYSDASAWGMAAIWGSAWFQAQWPQQCQPWHISVREFIPLAVAILTWGPTWGGASVLFHSDNMAVVDAVRFQSAKDPLLSCILRFITFYALQFNVYIMASHIPGEMNTKADFLSRFQPTHEFICKEHLAPTATPIQKELLSVLTSLLQSY